ncbi:heparinase II/III domain-containing protein [Pseudoduganella sp. HUAS MS19]
MKIRFIAVLAAAACAATASAQALPTPIRSSHPYILGHKSDFDRLKAQLPIVPANFPYPGGVLSFTFTPRATEPNSTLESPVFSDFAASSNRMFVRRLEKYGADSATLQIGLVSKSHAGWIAVATATVPLNAPTRIEVRWNAGERYARYRIGNAPEVAMAWKTDGNGVRVPWQPDDQDLTFTGRPGETIEQVKITDLDGNVILERGAIEDRDIHTAWAAFTSYTDRLAGILLQCPTLEAPASAPEACNVGTGHRAHIAQQARDLALGYRMTGSPYYKAAALNYLDKLFKVTPVTLGTEWSMGGRVSALGVMYDWMYDDLASTPVPGDPDGLSYTQKIAGTIKNTVAGRSAKPSEDLNTMICGYQSVTNTATVFDCARKPMFENWNRFTSGSAPTIAPYYISGHHASAISNTALGLLAIANEHPEVMPMIETAYAHFEKGFMKARSWIAVDGGYPIGYAYGASSNQFGERLLMWRKATEEPVGAAYFSNDWTSKLIYPLIYGLRANNTYPALGDNFTFDAKNALVGELALHAALDKQDMHALAFYQQVVRPARGTKNRDEVYDRLFFPAAGTAGELNDLDKARYFRRSGQVLMRDSWDFANATLLEFKSSNFVSQNHQHLDQNSIALSYKKPLLLDSGLYENYHSSHFNNYYTRTIAHNSIVVFDPSERFMLGTNEVSNDGGQWFKSQNNVQIMYPTIEEIQPGAVNYLDGVTRFENTEKYTYAVGNASKAYSSSKLDQAQGFVRSVLFLRGDQARKPVSIVFDRVQTFGKLGATFLLHSANVPAVNSPTRFEDGGRFKADAQNGEDRRITIRNGEGMVTVQTLLPAVADLAYVGGHAKGYSCPQSNPAGSSAEDCRFMVRERQGDNHVWRNFKADPSTQQLNLEDVGSYRVEISTPATSLGSGPQYFLHVMSVADNDGRSDVTVLDTAKRLDSEPNTAALLLNGQTVVALNRENRPASSLQWKTAAAPKGLIATGLIPGAKYRLDRLGTLGDAYHLVQTTEALGNLRSSPQGVITIGY